MTASIIIFFLLLILASAFFSGTETAYFNIKSHREDIPDKIKKLLSRPKSLLVSILTGNTLVNVTIGSLSAFITSKYISESPDIIFLQIIVVSLILIIFGEILPKIIAIRYSNKFAEIVYTPLIIIIKLFNPITFILNLINKFILNFIPKKEKSFDTEEELEILAELGEEGVSLDEDESDMIKSIFKFDDKTVREIMTPRVDISGLSTTSTIDDALDFISNKQYSKIPIYKENIDDIVGILYAKDLVPYLIGSRPSIDLRSISREVYFVPEQKPIDDLLSDFRKQRKSLAIVVDEWGGTSGLVTLEDIVEEVMGEIRDPYDIEDSPVEIKNDGSYIVDGKISVYDLEEEIEGMKFPENRDYDTLAGLILDRLEDIPKINQSIEYDDWIVRVISLDGNRIKEVQINKIDDKTK